MVLGQELLAEWSGHQRVALDGCMKIAQDGPLSWLVESESNPLEVHTVTLYRSPEGRTLAHCSCTDFETRRAPNLRRGGSLRANHCKHIGAVAEFIKWAAIDRMVELFDEGDNNA